MDSHMAMRLCEERDKLLTVEFGVCACAKSFKIWNSTSQLIKENNTQRQREWKWEREIS